MAYTPTIVDAWLTLPYKGYPGVVRYHNRNWAGIQAFGVHVQDGSSNGTQMHFRSVLASSTVLIDKDGTIRRLVPEDKAPWTNGDVKNPDAEVRALMNKYGPDPNTWMLTIECEGFSGGLPYTEAQYQSILWQLNDWKRKYGDKPVLPHYKINSVTRSTCPENPNRAVLMPRLHKDMAGGSTAPVEATFKRGDAVNVTDALNIRREPQPDGHWLGTLEAGTKATIIAGPVSAGGYDWYDISVDGFGTGHVAGNWLEKAAAPAPAPKPIPADKTFTTRFPLPIRQEPGFSGRILATLPTGTTGTIIEGPIEKDGIDWYDVRVEGFGTGFFPGSIMHTLAIK